MAKKKGVGKVKNFATCSFQVGDRSRISQALKKFCCNEVVWRPVKNGYRYDGEAIGLQNFIAFFWKSKQTASLAGKGAAEAKKRILREFSTSSMIGLNDDSNLKNGIHSRSNWSALDMSIDFSQPPPYMDPIPEVRLNISLTDTNPNMEAIDNHIPDDIDMHTIDSSIMDSKKHLPHHPDGDLYLHQILSHQLGKV